MINLRKFTQYTPKDGVYPDLVAAGAIFLRTSDGKDWYEAQSLFKDYTMKVVYQEDTGIIMGHSIDVSRLCPYDMCVAEVPNEGLATRLDNSGIYVYRDGTITRRSLTGDDIRNERAKLLKKIDLVGAVYWASVSSSKQAEWIKYRKDLLDIPEQEGFPTAVIWPKKPEM